MISVSSAFSTANAKLAKQPVHIFQVGKYPNGLAFSNPTSITTIYPMLGIGGIVGAFTDGTGQVIQPIEVGAGTRVTVPVGATQLQLGINHDEFFLNTGSFTVSVNGANITIPGTTAPWVWVRGGLNNSYIYGLGVGLATSGPTTAPLVVVSGMTAGKVVDIQYVSGFVNCFTLGFSFTECGPDGDPTFITGNFQTSNSDYCTIFMPTTLRQWLVSLDDLKVTINDLDGSSNLANLGATIQDYQQGLTAALAASVYEGQPARLLSGFSGMTIDTFATLFRGVVDVIESANYNLEYKFTCPTKNAKKLSQTIYTAGDDGFPTDSKHPRTLNGHPLDMLVSALQQCGVTTSDIDTAKIYYYRDTVFNGLSFVFSLTSAPTAKDFIENELMKPLGMYWKENNLGQITINSFYPALSGNGTYTPPTYPQATETVNTITDVPVEQTADLVDQVIFRFDENGNGFDAETVQTWVSAVTKYGLFGGHIVESKGLRSSFQGYYMAAIIARLIFLRYGGKQIVLDPLPLLWSECVLEPGDIIAVTLAYLPDRKAGTLGITTKTFEVLDRNWRFMEGICELKLLEIDLTMFKQYLITPNAEPDFASDTAPNQAKYMYLCDAAGKYSTGAPGNTLG